MGKLPMRKRTGYIKQKSEVRSQKPEARSQKPAYSFWWILGFVADSWSEIADPGFFVAENQIIGEQQRSKRNTGVRHVECRPVIRAGVQHDEINYQSKA